jgi:hypothetical protein
MLQRARYEDVKALCLCTAGAKANLFIEDSAFERRPKLAGLWVRFSLRDGDRLEGILGNNLLDWPERGYWITPPHAGPGRRRVFLARRALTTAEVLGVIGAKRLPATKGQRLILSQEQLPMFPD